MIVLEPEPEPDESKIAAHSVKMPVSDEHYAMVDSGAHAIIVPLRPDLCGEIAECKVPSAMVEGPIVQVLKSLGCCVAPTSHPHIPGVAHR